TVATAGAREGGAPVDDLDGGVRDDAVVDARAASAQRTLHAPDQVGLFAQNLIGDHDRPLDTQPLGLERKVAHAAAAVDHARGLIEIELQIGLHLPALLVQKLGWHRLRGLDQRLGGSHEAHDDRHLPFELELLLHHALDWIELFAHDLLPARVFACNAEGRLLGLGARAKTRVAADALVQVEPQPDVLADPDRGIGLGHERDRAKSPVLARSLVGRALVDGFLVCARPLVARKHEHAQGVLYDPRPVNAGARRRAAGASRAR